MGEKELAFEKTRRVAMYTEFCTVHKYKQTTY